jgi:hypothetical protein
MSRAREQQTAENHLHHVLKTLRFRRDPVMGKDDIGIIAAARPKAEVLRAFARILTRVAQQRRDKFVGDLQELLKKHGNERAR